MENLFVVGRRLWWACDGKRLPCVVEQVLSRSSKNVYCLMLIPHGTWERRSLDKASLSLREEAVRGESKVGPPPA